MAPPGFHPFSVNVLLSQAATHDADSVWVSKDIYSDIAPTEHRQRYLALSLDGTQRWKIFIAKQGPSSAPEHSTVWLKGKVYDEFSAGRILVRSASPIELKSVMLSFPAATYHLVNNESADLQVMLQAGHVFRTGESVLLNGYRGKITFCEPVMQGILTRETEIFLARNQSEQYNSHIYDEILVGSASEDDSDTELDGFSSLLLSKASMTVPDQAQLSYSIPALAISSELWVQIQPLPIYVHWDQIVPQPDTSEDDAYRAFAPMQQLIDMNCFSGDYIEICLPTDAMTGKKVGSRVLRVFTLPSDKAVSKTNSLFVPPILYHNIVNEVLPSSNASVRVHKVSRKKETPIAKAVVLARVPSPASMDRALQTAFLSALKVYFERCRRIVRPGDLLLLGIDETLARVMSSDEQDDETMQEFSQYALRQLDTFSCFRILDVEVDGHEIWNDEVQICSSSTRMVQAGLNKARLPELTQWAGYYGLATPPVVTEEPGTAHTIIYDLIRSTFSKSARKARACASILLSGARGSGKKTLVSTIAASLGLHFLEVNCFDIVGESDIKTEAYLRLRFERAAQCAPCVLLLRNIDALAKKNQDIGSGHESAMRFVLADCLQNVAIDAGDEFPAAVIATTADKEKIPEGVIGCFKHDVEISAPNEGERLAVLQTLLKNVSLAPDVSLQSLAVRSAALVAIDLVNVLKRARNFAQDRMDDLALSLGPEAVFDLQVAGGWVTAADFDKAISEARRNYSDSIGAPRIPNVTWEDVGGLASVKDDIMDTIQLPLERPELFASGMKKRSGILFYGPPGTGKTLLAKAVATSFSLNFFSVKGPELLNMYIGESEANVRRVFQRARDAKPCVVFFDELDSVAPKRGNQGDSGGVMDRIVSQLLSELDGMSDGKDGSGGVFVIGATNRPDLLDPALLRPGRFDKMLYLGVSDSDDAQLNILQALTRKFKLSVDLDLRDIAKSCPFTYTGADFYALCSDAMLKAMTRQAGAIDAKVKSLEPPRSTQYFFDHLATKEDVEVVVSEHDFRAAMKELIPSVSQSELEHYKKVQAQFSPVKNGIPSVVDKGKGKAPGLYTNGSSSLNGHSNGHFGHEASEDDAGMYEE